MNAHNPDRTERPNVIIADASKVSPREFYEAVTGRKLPTETEKAERYERDQAWVKCQRKLLSGPRYDPEYHDRCCAEYRAELDAIEAKYALPPELKRTGTDGGFWQ